MLCRPLARGSVCLEELLRVLRLQAAQPAVQQVNQGLALVTPASNLGRLALARVQDSLAVSEVMQLWLLLLWALMLRLEFQLSLLL